MKILVIYSEDLWKLPPLLTLINILAQNNHVDVIHTISEKRTLYVNNENVTYITAFNLPRKRHFIAKVFRKLKKDYLFYHCCKRYLDDGSYDVVWVGSLETALELKTLLSGKKYILNIYELYDKFPKLIKQIKPYAQKAWKVIVPEYNRANILKLWLGLKKTPLVIPNKPFEHPLHRNIENSYFCSTKKVILYQGHITRDRNIEALCLAAESLSEYEVVIMGKGGEYLDYLQGRYKCVKFLDFVTPPDHLLVTSWAYIGVVTYDYYSLNTLYCAPNKTWEYSGFGIPMLANDIPGLQLTVGKYKAGKCIDMDNVAQIINAIKDIDKNYESFSNNALMMYNSCNVGELVDKVLS